MHKVLLIDDEVLMREALKCVLGQCEGMTVIGEAASNEEALALIDVRDPDIVFLNIDTACNNIQNLINYTKSNRQKNRIVLLTGFDSFLPKNEIVKMKADGFIRKPISQQEIMENVSRHVSVHSISGKKLEEAVGEFTVSVFQNDFKQSKDELRKLTQLMVSSFGHDIHRLRSLAGMLAKNLERLSYEKGLFTNKKVDWAEKAGYIDKHTIENTLISLLEELFQEIIEHKSIHGKKEIQAAINYIDEHFHEGVTLEEVAEHVHLSPFYLSKLFKKELDVNFVSYVTERKMEKAKELLQSTDMPILNIALELNYQEANYFSKVFKKITGMTPSDFRKAKEKEKHEAEILKKHHPIQNGRWFI